MSMKLEQNQRYCFAISAVEKVQCQDDLLISQHDAGISADAQNTYGVGEQPAKMGESYRAPALWTGGVIRLTPGRLPW